MSFSRSIRKFILLLLVAGTISYGLNLYAQQSGSLTPPPKPAGPKTSSGTSATAATASTSRAASVSDGRPFLVGERLSFNITWANFPTAARLEMEVMERGQFFGQESYQVRTKVETVAQVRSLFGEIDNQYTSYISTKNALPHRVINSLRQGPKQSEETIIFDQFRQQAVFSDVSTLSIPAGTFDLASLLYGLRLRALPTKGKQKLNALYGKEIIEIEAEFESRERITTQTGTYNTVCVKFSPQKRLSRYRVFIWFSDDEHKLPVLMKAKLSFGEVRAELTSATVNTRSLPPLARTGAPTDESGVISVSLEGTNGTTGLYGAGDRALPFGVGERLNYDVAWGNFNSVGRASFEVRQQGMLGNHRVFEFYGEATTTGTARTLINVSDQLSSFALADKLIPVRTDLRLREGRRNKQVSATYNLKKNSAALSTGGEVVFPPGTLDMVSLFYAVRASELKIGAAYNYLFLDANYRLQMVRIKVVKQEAIGGPLGTRDALQLDVMAPEPSKLVLAQVWISNDAQRLPLYLATRTRFGELRLQLTSAVNTK